MPTPPRPTHKPKGNWGRYRSTYNVQGTFRQHVHSEGHRIHRDTDIGQQYMREQAANNYRLEKMLIMRSPIALPDPEEGGCR